MCYPAEASFKVFFAFSLEQCVRPVPVLQKEDVVFGSRQNVAENDFAFYPFSSIIDFCSGTVRQELQHYLIINRQKSNRPLQAGRFWCVYPQRLRRPPVALQLLSKAFQVLVCSQLVRHVDGAEETLVWYIPSSRESLQGEPQLSH